VLVADREHEHPLSFRSSLIAHRSSLINHHCSIFTHRSSLGLLDRCEGESGHRRARCWAQLDQTLSEKIVPWLPIYATAAAYVVSPRVSATYLDQSAFLMFPALERTEVADSAPPD
jgi:hypothetical protein